MPLRYYDYVVTVHCAVPVLFATLPADYIVGVVGTLVVRLLPLLVPCWVLQVFRYVAGCVTYAHYVDARTLLCRCYCTRCGALRAHVGCSEFTFVAFVTDTTRCAHVCPPPVVDCFTFVRLLPIARYPLFGCRVICCCCAFTQIALPLLLPLLPLVDCCCPLRC